MKRWMLVLLCALAYPCARASAQLNIYSGFPMAERMVSDSRQSYHPQSYEARESRSNERADSAREPQPDYRAIARERKREQERARREAERQEAQRVQNNLESITASLAAASAPPPPPQITPRRPEIDIALIAGRRLELEKILRGPAVRPLKDYTSEERRQALANAHAVHNAVNRGEMPPFRPLWDYYEYNRSIAKGLMPEENRCAIVMSMTLGLQPAQGELSVHDLPDKQKTLLMGLVSTKQLDDPQQSYAGTNTQVGSRYYVNATQLAARLNKVLGAPEEFDSLDAAKSLNGRKGIVYLDRAYLHAGLPELLPHNGEMPAFFRRGNHIDVWNSNMNASDSSMPFDKAHRVLFWEIK